MLHIFKKIRRILKDSKMAKRRSQKKRGHSVRNGNTPSCYQKFGKRPYVYSKEYQDWNRRAKAGASVPIKKPEPRISYAQAAE